MNSSTIQITVIHSSRIAPGRHWTGCDDRVILTAALDVAWVSDNTNLKPHLQQHESNKSFTDSPQPPNRPNLRSRDA